MARRSRAPKRFFFLQRTEDDPRKKSLFSIANSEPPPSSKGARVPSTQRSRRTTKSRFLCSRLTITSKRSRARSRFSRIIRSFSSESSLFSRRRLVWGRLMRSRGLHERQEQGHGGVGTLHVDLGAGFGMPYKQNTKEAQRSALSPSAATGLRAFAPPLPVFWFAEKRA